MSEDIAHGRPRGDPKSKFNLSEVLESRRNDVRRRREAGESETQVFEAMATASLEAKQKLCTQRCPVCWHDARQSCICSQLGSLTMTLPVKVLVLMHYKEYLSAGDDAKLILAMLPPDRAQLYVFGRTGDWDLFARELAIDPAHTLLLWPGDGARTVETWQASLPADSAWCGEAKREAAADAADASAAAARPMLRVVVLDGVYSHARCMYRAMRRRLPPAHLPPHIALHPTTLSVYHRATSGYASASAVSVAGGETGDEQALRICTVEAAALLLTELGEPEGTTRALVDAVVVNNHALAGYRCDVRKAEGKVVLELQQAQVAAAPAPRPCARAAPRPRTPSPDGAAASWQECGESTEDAPPPVGGRRARRRQLRKLKAAGVDVERWAPQQEVPAAAPLEMPPPPVSPPPSPSPMPPPPERPPLHPEVTSEEIEACKELLDQPIRVGVSDGRIFIGTFACFDKQRNLLLYGAHELAQTSRALSRPPPYPILSSPSLSLISLPTRVCRRTRVPSHRRAEDKQAQGRPRPHPVA